VPVFCGVDVGTQGSKVGFYRGDGTCIADAYAEHTFDNLRPGWVEMDPDQILDAVVSAVAAAVDAGDFRPSEVASIAMSGILCGPVFVDESFVPVRPIIPFLDTRASAEVDWLSNEVEPRWVDESANAALDTYVMPAVYEWIRRNEPDVCARIAKILSLAPYIGGKLAGATCEQAWTDPSHLSGWVIGWNARTGTVSEQQMQDLGIDIDLAPRVHAPTDVVGSLCAAMAERTGLPVGVPICAGAGDVMQSNLGAGLTRPGMATDVAGTASILTVGVTEPSPAITAVPGMLYSLSALSGQALYWGYVKAGGLSLRWFRDQLLGRTGDDALYAEADGWAAQVAPGSDGVLFAPYLSGGGPDNPHASGTWLGMTMATERGTLWRSMLEAIAFEYAEFLDVFRANGAPVDEVLAVGGGARSPLWNQIKADVVGMRWRVPSRQDGAILANAALGGVGVGELSGLAATVSGWVTEGEAYEPRPEVSDVYATVRSSRAQLLAGPLREAFDHTFHLRS